MGGRGGVGVDSKSYQPQICPGITDGIAAKLAVVDFILPPPLAKVTA